MHLAARGCIYAYVPNLMQSLWNSNMPREQYGSFRMRDRAALSYGNSPSFPIVRCQILPRLFSRSELSFVHNQQTPYNIYTSLSIFLSLFLSLSLY